MTCFRMSSGKTRRLVTVRLQVANSLDHPRHYYGYYNKIVNGQLYPTFSIFNIGRGALRQHYYVILMRKTSYIHYMSKNTQIFGENLLTINPGIF